MEWTCRVTGELDTRGAEGTWKAGGAQVLEAVVNQEARSGGQRFAGRPSPELLP